ncbi:hypothetical protein MBLNU230_g4208t1 [Neophaeotheca triangularis]
MVSFWPFRGDDTSAASFEKALSQLSDRINKASSQNDNLRQHQRRFKALWTLYSGFAYILIALILVLVTGWEQWGPVEYSSVSGGPVLIFGVRTTLDTYYNYRISKSQAHLNHLQKQRETTIEKLKAATKYNSTQQLLDKYGGTPAKKRGSSPPAGGKRKVSSQQSKQQLQNIPRTGFAPPPTANIQGRPPPPGMAPPNAAPPMPNPNSNTMGASPVTPEQAPTEEFAPNAFPASTRPPAPRAPPSQYAADGPKWYDRILDVVLGDDETQAKNRIALICDECKLVNGQAPPGARTLEDVGRWRCSSCHAWNGVESEAKQIMQQMREVKNESRPGSVRSSKREAMESSTEDFERVGREPVAVKDETDGEESDEVDGVGNDAAADNSPAASTRSKARQRKKA